MMNNFSVYIGRWTSLFKGSNNNFINSYFNYLVNEYSMAYRKYHNFDHIKVCLSNFDLVKSSISDPRAVEIAIWFHDLVYKTFSSRNEINSAKAADAFLTNIDAGANLINTVNKLILSTAHLHNPGTDDEKYIMDIDCAILGSSREDFLKYEDAIRREYKLVPRFIYRGKRRLVLEKFLEKEYIFYTDEFRSKYEKKAQDNITTLLACL